MLTNLSHTCRLIPVFSLFIGSAALFPGVAPAQLGVSPSQNASFLNELRGRDPKRAEENRDVLGDARQKLDAGRELSRPELFSSSVASPTRLVTDITGFTSQYQAGRRYLTPWYDGVLAPETTFADSAGFTGGIALEQGFEYNSAIKGGSGGLIVSTTVLLDGTYKLAENQQLSISGGLGLNWINGNDDFGRKDFSNNFGLTVLPGTSITYDAQFGPVSITLYDRVSLRTYQGMLQNDLGIAGTWQMTPALTWTVNFTHTSTHDVDHRRYGRFQNQMLAGDLDTCSSLISYDLNTALTVGVEGALSSLDRDNDREANDGTLGSYGAFVTWKLSPDTRLRFAVGYQHMEFENTARIWPFFLNYDYDRSDLHDPYYNLTFSQRLSDRVSHELSIGYESDLDVSGNFTRNHFANYGITVATPWRGGQFTASGFYEYSDPSESIWPVLNVSYGVDLYLAQQLCSKLSVGVGFAVTNFHSDYGHSHEIRLDQTMAGLDLNYALNAKTHVRLSCQNASTTIDYTRYYNNNDRFNDFRVSLSVRMQF